MVKGAALSFQATVVIVIGTVSVVWGIAWGVNKYMFAQEQSKAATSEQIESLSLQLSVVSSNQATIYKRMNLLDSIREAQRQQATNMHQLNTAVRTMAKSVNLRTDALINIIEQLPPLLTQKKTLPPPIPYRCITMYPTVSGIDLSLSK